MRISDWSSDVCSSDLRALIRRYPERRFIWLMGADNLAQFHRWRNWRDIARLLPIAVVARPGYDRDARFAVAMGWLRRFVHPGSQALNRSEEHTSELQSLMRISYAVFCLNKQKKTTT